MMYSLISVYRHKYEMNRIYGRKFSKTHSYPKFRTRKHYLNHFSNLFCFHFAYTYDYDYTFFATFIQMIILLII